MAEVPLTELIAAIGTSVNEAQQAIEELAVRRYQGYFTPAPSAGEAANGGKSGGGTSLVPGLTNFSIPSPDGKTVRKEVNVPNVTMLPHETMNLDVVRVSLAITSCRMVGGKLKVEVDGQGRSAAGKNAGKAAGKNSVEDEFVVAPSGCQFPFAGRYGSAVEMVFRHAPPAEGIRRMNVEQVKILP